MLVNALYYITKDNNSIKCTLCPHFCVLKEGQIGFCNVRQNIDGKLQSLNYGILSAINTDPIEKKPLYHFHPDKQILSIGSVGCNLKCNFCQNSEISQSHTKDYPFIKEVTPEQISYTAQSINNNIGIAYTYNEPTIFYEYMLKTAKLNHENGLKNVMISNGYINKVPLKELIKNIDAFNIDIKSISNDFYIKHTKGRLQPVLDTIEYIINEGKHIELTNLILPTLNDSKKEFEKLISTIKEIGGVNIIFHISKYFPHYKSEIKQTGTKKIVELFSIAKKHLNHVYIGNLDCSKGQNTYCPICGNTLIKRTNYYTTVVGLNKQVECKKCKTKIKNIIL